MIDPFDKKKLLFQELIEAKERMAQNPAANVNQVYGGILGAGLGVLGQELNINTMESLPDRLAREARDMKSKAEVLTWIEAQLRMNLFAHDANADRFFKEAMSAAATKVKA